MAWGEILLYNGLGSFHCLLCTESASITYIGAFRMTRAVESALNLFLLGYTVWKMR